jgi:hypothetical protein
VTGDEFATWLAEVTGRTIETIEDGPLTHHYVLREEGE